MRRIIAILFALVCIFSFSAVTVLAMPIENAKPETAEKYSDGRPVEGNDIRYISPKMMQHRFIKKTEFMNDGKYETVLQNAAIKFNMMLNMYLDVTQTEKLVKDFPENYADFSDYDKFVFIWTYAESCSNLNVYGGYADYANSVKTSVTGLDLYYPNDDISGYSAYIEAVTEALTWHYNNWLMETTVYNPYEFADEIVEEITEESTGMTREIANETTTETATISEIETVKIEPSQQTFLQKYWFSFVMIAAALLAFVIYKIVKVVKK